MEGKDEYTLTTDGGETLKFCSEGCMETYRQETSSSGGWRDELLSWGGWYKVGNQYRKEWSMIWRTRRSPRFICSYDPVRRQPRNSISIRQSSSLIGVHSVRTIR